MSLPLVISVPHCSGRIPGEIRAGIALTDHQIEESTDMGTREIFGSLNAEVVLCSRWSRLVVDLNRDPQRRDPMGVVPLVDYFGRPVYETGALPEEDEIRERLTEFYRPYHHRLRSALGQRRIRGLIDCHSLSGKAPPGAPDAGRKREDIVLSNNGDRNGRMTRALGPTTCSPELLGLLKDSFLKAGFSVTLNRPYTGGFIVTHYGDDLRALGKFALQLEINQELFAGPEGKGVCRERLARIGTKVQACLDEFAGMM